MKKIFTPSPFCQHKTNIYLYYIFKILRLEIMIRSCEILNNMPGHNERVDTCESLREVSVKLHDFFPDIFSVIERSIQLSL